MPRSVIEVAGIAVIAVGLSVALSWAEIGHTRGVPAIAGAGLAASAIVLSQTRRPLSAVVAGLFAMAGAFCVDGFVVFVAGAGHLDLREIRKEPLYAALIALLFVWPATTDVRSIRARAGDERAAR